MSSHSNSKSSAKKKENFFLKSLQYFVKGVAHTIFSGSVTAVLIKLVVALILLGVVAAQLGMPSVASALLQLVVFPIVGIGFMIMWKAIFR